MLQKHEGKNTLSSCFSKLDVEVAPKLLENLRKLEKTIISKRVLFKKVAIMHRKEESAKIKGNT